MQHSQAFRDLASLVSAGAGIPMFANLSFLKTEDVTPEILNPFGLKMVSVNIYTTIFPFSIEHILFMTSTVFKPVG